jgi:hypothetical protein
MVSEPKHIPLPERLREYAAAKAEEFRAALEAADDAHDVIGDAPPLPTDAELAAEYDQARGYDRPIEERRREAYEACKDAPIVRWTKGQKTLPEFVECDGKCITAAEVGVPEAGGMYAVDPECTLHGKALPALEEVRRKFDDAHVALDEEED